MSGEVWTTYEGSPLVGVPGRDEARDRQTFARGFVYKSFGGVMGWVTPDDVPRGTRLPDAPLQLNTDPSTPPESP